MNGTKISWASIATRILANGGSGNKKVKRIK
jgi:hypothetical protein